MTKPQPEPFTPCLPNGTTLVYVAPIHSLFYDWGLSLLFWFLRTED